ncbi:hypothetical protein [Mesorhizobium sp. M0898]|uniref:hypothetical protein n=1 Tax=Mesorhizobium sp. M0898 TaxID=2957020 RepID=UPI00333BB24E
MTNLSADRNTQRRERGSKSVPMAAAKIFAGSIVCRNATGYATKGAADTTLHAIGRAAEQVDNSAGAPGDLRIRVDEGIFRWANSGGGDLIGISSIGHRCFIADDQTVAKTSGAGTRAAAGIVVDVDAVGVCVLMGEDVLAEYDALRTAFVPVRVATLVGANVYRNVSAYAGRVTKIMSVTEGVLTTGDATLTGKINGVAITTGVVAITQAGSAAGDKDEAVPTAANVVAIGDELSLTVGGTNASATVANAIFVIERD